MGLYHSRGRPNIFGRQNFTYNLKEDVYVYPAGELMPPLGKKKGEEAREEKVTT